MNHVTTTRPRRQRRAFPLLVQEQPGNYVAPCTCHGRVILGHGVNCDGACHGAEACAIGMGDADMAFASVRREYAFLVCTGLVLAICITAMALGHALARSLAGGA